MKFTIRKTFNYSPDGIEVRTAHAGGKELFPTLPADCLAGLMAEGFIAPSETPAADPAPAAVDPAPPEDPTPADQAPPAEPTEAELRAAYQEKFGRKPHARMDPEKIKARLAE